MRAIKFRAWDQRDQRLYSPVELKVVMNTGSIWDLEGIVWLQYTGLDDNHAQEIYDGDIVKLRPRVDRLARVFWDDKSACFRLCALDDGATINLGSAHSRCTVVGNTFESPDLLDSKAVV